MRNKANRHIGMKVTPEMHYKLNYIAQYEGRSCNELILRLVRECVKKYEKENGEIMLSEQAKKQ